MQPSQNLEVEEEDKDLLDKEVSDKDEDDGEDAKSGPSGHGTHDRPAALPTRRISPFELHFSQVRARGNFRDGRQLETSIAEIQAVRCEAEEVTGAGGEDSSGKGDSSGEVWRLQAPFPPIEVLQWRCKLRDEQTGRPRVDPKTGGELVDHERYFSLDNRRLYCLQKAAAGLWPKRAVIDVVELPPGSLMRQRQIKKFRTLDRGRSIMIGCRADASTQVHWSWRKVVGVEAEDSDLDDGGCHVQMRRRPRAEHRAAWALGPASPPVRRRRPESAEEGEGGGQSSGSNAGLWGVSPTSVRGVVLVLLIYLALRTSVSLFAAVYENWRR